jgi:rubredoxin
MKIIQPGQINEVDPNWWHGKRLTCECCRCIFELEPGDFIDAYASRTRFGDKRVTVMCPTCEAPVTYREGGNIGSITFNGVSVPHAMPGRKA